MAHAQGMLPHGHTRPRGWHSPPHSAHLAHTAHHKCLRPRRTRATTELSAAPATSSNSKAARLKAWVEEELQRSGLTRAQPTLPSLTPQANDSGGFDMVTQTSVEAGQALVCVPRRLLLTYETAKCDPEYGPLITQGPLTEWQGLTLALLVERARGDKSFWAPYLDMLPSQDDHPLFWSEERLSWLQGSPMQDTLRARQEQVQEDYEALEIVGANDIPSATHWAHTHEGQPLVTVSSVTWAAATLLSRAFSLDLSSSHTDDSETDESEMSDQAALYTGESSDLAAAALLDDTGLSSSEGLTGPSSLHTAEDTLCVVPWADTLNHSSEAGEESCLRYQPDIQAATLSAHTSYSPGNQVYDSYGPLLAPTDLLLDYGYCDPTNTNHRVEVDVTQIVIPTSKQARTLWAALTRLQTSTLQGSTQQGSGEAAQPVRMAVSSEGPDQTLLTWVRAGLSTDADLIRAGWRVRATAEDIELACRVMGRLAQPTTVAMETRVLNTVRSHLASLLERYPPQLPNSQDSQHDVAPHIRRLRDAVSTALASEQTALKGAIAACDNWLHLLEEGCPVEELYLSGDLEEGEYEEGEE